MNREAQEVNNMPEEQNEAKKPNKTEKPNGKIEPAVAENKALKPSKTKQKNEAKTPNFQNTLNKIRRQKMIIRLQHYGYTLEEIAQELGVNPSTIDRDIAEIKAILAKRAQENTKEEALGLLRFNAAERARIIKDAREKGSPALQLKSAEAMREEDKLYMEQLSRIGIMPKEPDIVVDNSKNANFVTITTVLAEDYEEEYENIINKNGNKRKAKNSVEGK